MINLSPRYHQHLSVISRISSVSLSVMMEYPITVQLHAKDQDLEIRVYFITPINNINATTHSGPNKICTEYILRARVYLSGHRLEFVKMSRQFEIAKHF